MLDLLILDLVMLLGISVLPRHAKRSYLAIRRLAKEGLREATAREPVSAAQATAGYVLRAVRSSRDRLSFETVRPALLPVAAALTAIALVAGYATWANSSTGERPVGVAAVVPEAPVQWLQAAEPEPAADAGDREAEAPEVRIACSEETAETTEAVLFLKRALETRSEVTEEYRAVLRRSAAEASRKALEAIPEAAALRHIRIL